MRMEELSENRYIKNTDTVERYLLNLVQEYFKKSNIASVTSREYIINKAVERMKEEITFDNIGVLSISVPNGEIRTGAIEITLDDLNGEPLISPKLSAFNVSFGTEMNTACEGNDSRLSDARKPLEHKHEISDIVGLEGILSTLTGKTDRADGFIHEHNNKSLLDILVYTGTKSIIDLTELDTLNDKVSNIIKEIEDEILKHEEEFNIKVKETHDEIDDIRNEISNVKNVITETNKDYYSQAQTYTDNEIVKLEEKLKTEINKLVTKEVITDFVNTVNNMYTLAGSMTFVLNSVININNDENARYSEIKTLDDNVISELNNRGQSLSQCQIEVLIEYTDPINGETVRSQLPYIIFDDYKYDGTLQVTTCFTDQSIRIALNTISGLVPEEIKACKIIYNVYSKENVAL